MSEADDRAAGWRKHLDTGLAQPDDTLVLATLDAKGGMMMQVRGTRPRDLMDLARSLLEQADSALDSIPGAEAEDLQEVCADALAILPSFEERTT
jgi:hypothetical protein